MKSLFHIFVLVKKLALKMNLNEYCEFKLFSEIRYVIRNLEGNKKSFENVGFGFTLFF